MAALRRLAGLSGASAVGAAAYGAHGLSDADPLRKKAFENGNRMHLVHSVMLAVAPILKPRAPRVSGTLFAAGIAIFSGSCYAAALTGVRERTAAWRLSVAPRSFSLGYPSSCERSVPPSALYRLARTTDHAPYASQQELCLHRAVHKT